jgi:hypothetical protein
MTQPTPGPEAWPPEIDTENYSDYRRPRKSTEEYEDFRFRIPQSSLRNLTTLAAHPAVRAMGFETAADLARAGAVAITRALQKSLDVDDPQLRYAWKREQLRARSEFLDEQAERVQTTLEHLHNYLMGLLDTEDYDEQERTLREFVAWADTLDPVWHKVYLRELSEHPSVVSVADSLRTVGRDLYWFPKGETDDREDER